MRAASGSSVVDALGWSPKLFSTGLIPATFADIAKQAEGGCPVSNALRGSLKIEVKASVK